ncbi:ExeA family protein [Celeribacter sp.]|uniref:ExeA family protein n=1 Tax=Celeribacter sp. TaxID=1890673 RepID=UPI003A8F33ED
MSTEGLYAGFFELSERPFTLLPDPSLLYWSVQHKRAFSVLEYGLLSRAPITLVSGEIGSGKTTLIQALLNKGSDDLVIGLISNAQGGRGELLQWVLNAFGISPEGYGDNYVSLFQRFQDFLIEQYAENRRVVLIIDEAQNLSTEGLEEIRMLTNINSNKDELLQLILVGQPELRNIVSSTPLRQLAQRIAASYHIGPLNSHDTAAYIAHRLTAVGGTGEEIAPEAAALIHARTGGVPRLVNQLCDLSMVYAWSADARLVTEATVGHVIDDGLFHYGALVAEAAE